MPESRSHAALNSIRRTRHSGIASCCPIFKSENPGTRAAATAIALHMTAMRADGAAVITNFLPVFAEHLADPTTLGRQNTAIAVYHVMGVLNDPPKEILGKTALAATDGERFALWALAETNPMPEWVSDILLTTKLDEQERLRALSHVRDMRPEIMAKLIYSLRSEDKAVVEVTLWAIPAGLDRRPRRPLRSFAGWRESRATRQSRRARSVWPNGWSRRANSNHVCNESDWDDEEYG